VEEMIHFKKKKCDSPVFDLEEDTPSTDSQARRPSRHKASKQDVKREALTLALQDIERVDR
jgi:hypothetical protein